MTVKSSAFAAVGFLLSLLVALVLSEAMARLFAPPWLEQRMAVLSPPSTSAAGFGTDRHWKIEQKDGKFLSFTPGSRFDVLHTEYRNVANIDALGLRRTFAAGEAQRGRVAALGDSFTFGVGVEDLETFVSILAARSPNVRFLNLGVPGSALPQQLGILKERHAELRPELYVFYFFLGNDFSDILDHEEAERQRVEKGEASPSAASNGGGFLWRVNDFVYHHPMLKHSYLIQLVRKFLLDALNAVQLGIDLPREPIFYVMDRSMVDYHARSAAALARQLDALVELQAELRFKSLIVPVPDVHQLSAERRNPRAQLYGLPVAQLEPFLPNEILKKAVTKAGLSFFDPTQCLLNSVKNADKLYYLQDTHFRPIGHQIFADCIGARMDQLVREMAQQ